MAEARGDEAMPTQRASSNALRREERTTARMWTKWSKNGKITMEALEAAEAAKREAGTGMAAI